MAALNQTAIWGALAAHKSSLEKTKMRDLFAADPKRFQLFSRKFNDILFDYSKNIVTEETVKLLVRCVYHNSFYLSPSFRASFGVSCLAINFPLFSVKLRIYYIFIDCYYTWGVSGF
jgi:hypothetical protein